MSEDVPLVETKRYRELAVGLSNVLDTPSKGVTRKRFWIVFCVALLNFSNTAQWIAYAPVGNYVNAYYGEGAAPWFSLIFMAVTIPMGFFGMWLGSSSGLRFSFLMAALFNATGSLIRLLSSGVTKYGYNFHVALLGQAVSALAYPFIMFLPSKTSADWFPSDERTTATTCGVLANPLGVLVVNFVVPYIVKSSGDVWILNSALFGLCVLIAAAILFTITENRPSCYPVTSAEQQISYFESVRMCMTNTTYVMLLLALGGGIGMFNCLYTMMQEMMCPAGYGNHIAGYCASAMIVLGTVGALLGGVFVDKYPAHCKSVLVIAMSFAVLFGLSLLQLTRFSGFPWILGAVSSLFGLFGLAVYPIGLQLASETTYPATPETASGLIVLMGQVSSVVFIAIVKQLAKVLSREEIKQEVQACKLHEEDTINVPKDYTTSILVVSAIAVFLPLLMALIKPTNVRLKHDRLAMLNEILVPKQKSEPEEP